MNVDEFKKGQLVRCVMPRNQNLGIVLRKRFTEGSKYQLYEVYVQQHGKLLLRAITEFRRLRTKK